MRRGLLAFEVVALAFAIGPGYAQVARAEEIPQYSAAEIRNMARAAQTPEQYTQLADYYQARRRMYVRKAAEEMDLVIQRNAVFTSLSEKWPRPVDSARNLYDYYLYQAAKSAATAARYADRANQAAAR
ncbi:MAG: hypothetical protein WCF17_02135 [Terracidiphilus sp.]